MAGRYCKVCSLEHSDDDPVHNGTAIHCFNFKLWEWNEYRRALVKNRHGTEVRIQPKPVNGHIYDYHEVTKKGKHCLTITPRNLMSHNNTLEFLCTVKNCRNSDSLILISAQKLHPYEWYSLYDPKNNLNNKFIELEAGTEYTVIVKYSPQNNVIGNYKIPLSFNFQTVDEKADRFTIARSIEVIVDENIPHPDDGNATKSPFTNFDWPDSVEIFPPTVKQRYLDQYPIPPDFYIYIKYGLKEYNGLGGADYIQLTNIRRELEPGFVTAVNYRMFWHIVLWLEEMGQSLMLKRYNMENVKMNLLGGKRLELVVPGLAEKRPSVIAGDMVEIRVHEDYRAYRGVIKKVNDKTVEIAYVDEELLNYIESNPDIELDVRFVMGRLPLERMHQGVDQTVMNGLVPALFPPYSLIDSCVPERRTVRDTEFFNKSIVDNAEQKTAVRKILNGTSRHAPYIVFGPPGTGKTITIVEAILQIKKKTTGNILICAPANAACDMLTEKLMTFCSKKELIRILSDSVDRESINQHILEYTNYVKDGEFRKITPNELKEYRIVITTLILVGRYTGKYHPDVVFIDEAAQASEPEVDCAIGMLHKGKQIILAGDPRQLGPSVRSKVAKKYGLGKSLLERLMDLDLYRTLNPNFITMLKLNFRSHSTILQLPNELFYDNQLQAVSEVSENDPLATTCVFDKIQGLFREGARGKKKNKIRYPGQAIEFCSLLSKESRQGRSPSYFNTKEMLMVLKFVQALLKLEFEDESQNVLAEQIGIVTPYIRQVYKIRTILRENNFTEVEVGTTETFQGREKRIIIISTVRAQKDLLLYDRKYDLGFVSNDKRFNVAVTRAMSKLIVIGCAHVLGTDSKWLRYIDLCEEKFSFCGAPFARRTQDVRDEIIRRMGHVNLKDTQHRT